MSAVPIVVTIILLLTRLPSWGPPVAGILLASGIGIWFLGTDTGDIVETVLGSGATLVKVLAIIGAGVLLSRMMEHSGAQRRLAEWLSVGGPTIPAALLMSHGVVPFLESATGFGVSLIIGLPLMMAFGFAVIPSAAMVLLGLIFINPWGSMGPGSILAAEIADSDLRDMGMYSGFFSLPAFVISGIFVGIIAGLSQVRSAGHSDVHSAGHSAGTGAGESPSARPALGRYLTWAGVGTASAMVLWVLLVGTNWLMGTNVAGAVSSGLMTAGWPLITRRGRLSPVPGTALLPYATLLGGTILGQFIGPLIDVTVLREVVESPALWALAGAVVCFLILPISAGARSSILPESLRMWRQAGLPNALYIVFGAVMAGGGLATALAMSLTSMGTTYLFMAPFLAGLSGYITASVTGANAMLGTTQIAAGSVLNVSSLEMMAMQSSASGIGVVAGPARIEVAYRMSGAEGNIRDFRVEMLRIVGSAVLLALLAIGLMSILVLG